MRIKTDIPLSLYFIKDALGKESSLKDRITFINAISTDTRNLMSGDLFIPLHGLNFNAEIFVKDAKSIGAYTLSELEYDFDTIKVESTENALLSIAKAYKKLLNLKCTVAITGSVGKTTTKNILIKLLSKKFNVCGTDLNYNNEIGVPLTVLSAKKNTEVLVIEAGMNHSGELSLISKTIEPDICIITKIGTAHIGNFGSREKIAKAKAEILDGMKNPFAIIPHNEILLNKIENKLTTSTNDSNADIYLSNWQTSNGISEFDLHFKDCTIKDLSVMSVDAHIPECLLFALGVCMKLNMSDSEIKDALKNISEPSSVKVEEIGNIKILDDSYNSSPESVNYAFKTLTMRKINSCSAVLGDMLELGNNTEQLHEAIGKEAAKAKLSSLYLFGEFSEFIKNGAIKGGMKENSIFINSDKNAPYITAMQIISNSSPGETVLLKGSRKMHMERIISELKKLYRTEEKYE